MLLSDVSIRRPVVCIVVTLIIVIVGALSFRWLPVREYPDIDPPVVSVRTDYPGAAPEVVETQITDPLEDQLTAIDGVMVIRSDSREQSSRISIEFDLRRNVDMAANDVRDKVGRARSRLPRDIDDPQVEKADADDDPIITLAFNSDRFSRLELAEMVDRIAVQRLQTVPGVAAISLRAPLFAMRLWVDPDRLAAFGLTIADIERALREQNVDVPSGRIESVAREFALRLQGSMWNPADFENLVLATRGDYQVKFADVGRVELGANDYRAQAFFNGRPTVALQILRQSQSNLLDVADGVKGLIPEIRRNMPDGVNINIAYDTSTFVERSVGEVYTTIYIACALVILTIFVFLRDWRATVIPLLAIPVSLIGTFAVMRALGFSINILTLLALVLAVGLVVDDAIVMLENIYRRIEGGEAAVHASIFGARQMAFAIISTTLTLAAVFLPVALQSGRTGRLFYEFGLTLAVAVIVSGFVALTLTPMLCSRVLLSRRAGGHLAHGRFYALTEPVFERINAVFAALLRGAFKRKAWMLGAALLFAAAGPLLHRGLQRELTPAEDRGLFRVTFLAPLGSTPQFTDIYARDIERILLETPEVERVYRGVGYGGQPHRCFFQVMLKPWEERTRTTQEVIASLRPRFRDNPGGMAIASPVRPLGGRRSSSGGVQMVLEGPDFGELQKLADRFVREMDAGGVFTQPRVDPAPNKPQLGVRIDRARAADLGVPVLDVATTLETLFGGRRVTRFRRGPDEYDVMVQVEDRERTSPADLGRIHVRSGNKALVQLDSLVEHSEDVVPESYPHFNRLRSLTISGQLAEGRTQGDGVDALKAMAARTLPDTYAFAWDGETREYVESSSDTVMLFGLALLFTFLILAAQFESWLHPVTIFTGVALAVSGGMVVLYGTRWWGAPMTDNLFSRFGLIMLIGLVAKNGILIVEFANQLQMEGRSAADAAFESATLRFRPILMTSFSTILGAVPVAFATGAGAETRNPLGIVVVGGLTLATFMTLFVIPVVYVLVDRACVRFTGHSSARGLIRAKEIARKALEAEGGMKV